MSSAYSHKTVNTFVLGSILVFGIIELAVVYRFFPKSYTSYMLLNPVYFFLLGLTVLLRCLVSRANVCIPDVLLRG